MRISDWSSDVCSSDLDRRQRRRTRLKAYFGRRRREGRGAPIWGTAHNGKLRVDPDTGAVTPPINAHLLHLHAGIDVQAEPGAHLLLTGGEARRSEEHTSELQSLMRISYAVFCLKKKRPIKTELQNY